MRYLELSSSRRQEGEWWLRGAGERKGGELLFNGYRILVLRDEKSPGDRLYNDVNVLTRLLNCTFING